MNLLEMQFCAVGDIDDDDGGDDDGDDDDNDNQDCKIRTFLNFTRIFIHLFKLTNTMPFLNVAVMLIGMPTMIQTAMVKLMIFNLECFI